MNVAPITPKELSEEEFKKLQGQYQARFGITMNKQVLLLFEAQNTAHLQEIELIKNLFEQQRQENATMYQKQIEVLNQKIREDREQHEKHIAVMEDAVVAIGKQKGAIITENPEVMAVVAKNNLSKYKIICSLIFFLSVLGVFVYEYHQTRQEKYQKITNALNTYPNIQKFQILAQRGTIESNPDGKFGEFLILTAPKKGEGAEAGKCYIYDQENERILVPLHYSKKPL
jgi:hypothetical protein